MKKKIYQKPKMKLVTIMHQLTLQKTSGSLSLGGKTTSGYNITEMNSRKLDLWDEDDDY